MAPMALSAHDQSNTAGEHFSSRSRRVRRLRRMWSITPQQETYENHLELHGVFGYIQPRLKELIETCISAQWCGSTKVELLEGSKSVKLFYWNWYLELRNSQSQARMQWGILS